MFKEVFGYPQNKKIKEDNKGNDMSRRDFIKFGVLGAAAAAISFSGINKIIENLSQDTGKEKDKKELEKEEEPATTGQAEIESEDIKSIEDVFSYKKDERILINDNTLRTLEKYWYRKYENELKPSLNFAYREMGAFEPHLENEFKAKNVDPKFRYLAVQESHFRVDANSGYAVGPYQFTRSTGERWGLKKTKSTDDRRDPVRSARACAEHLKYLYGEFGEDWDMALAGYNGSFVWRFKSSVEKEGKKLNMANFLSFLERTINKIKEEIDGLDRHAHKVARGETLRSISRSYGVSMEDLVSENKIRDINLLRAGDYLQIPINDDLKAAVFYKKISGYIQNINYPAKFKAISRLIEEKKVDVNRKKSLYFGDSVKAGEGAVFHKHRFKADDRNLYQLSKKYQLTDYRLIMAANPGLSPSKLREGMTIKIPAGPAVTLTDIARTYDVPIKELRILNPSVMTVNLPLPANYEIRLGKTIR